MNMYSYGSATPVYSAPAATSSVATVTPTLPAGWITLGCYSDSQAARALGAFFNEPSTGMTVELCISDCVNAGYTIAGLEYELLEVHSFNMTF